MKTPFLFQARALLVAAVLPLVTATAAATVAAESPSLLLQKGIYAEEIERNLDSAIKIYEQIAAESAANRTVVAQAQYRLAVCYQKKGNKEKAIKLLNELVQFSTDAGVGAQARQALVGLGQAPLEGVAIRKVPLPPDAMSTWAISADARYIAYSTSSDGDVAIFEPATGRIRRIATADKNEGTWSSVCFSPDSLWLAYDRKGTSIMVSRVDGTQSRTVYKAANEKEWLEALDWSPDAAQVIVGEWVTRRPEAVLFMIDVKTGAKKEVTRLTNAMTTYPSPDGRQIAYRKGPAPGRLVLVDRGSGREETIVGSDVGRVEGWALAGMKLVYAVSRAKTKDFWMIGIQDGRAAGEPELVMSNLGDAYTVGITRSGNIYYQARPTTKSVLEPRTLWVMEGFLTRKVAPIPPPPSPVQVSEILGPNNAILDAKTGLAATLPASWQLARAQRPVDGPTTLVINFELPENTEGRSSLLVWKDPKSIPSAVELAAPRSAAEVDVWLRKLAESRNDKRKAEERAPNYRATKFTPRTIGKNRALSWTGEFDRGDRKIVEQATLIYSEASPCFVQMSSLAASAAELRVAYEILVESVRLP